MADSKMKRDASLSARPGRGMNRFPGNRAGRPPASSPAALFREMRDAFERAVQRAGSLHRDFIIGEHRVRLRFAGPTLAPHLTPALAHLAAPSRGAPDLTVCVWDSDSTGVRLGACPWRPEQVAPGNGEVRGWSDERMPIAMAVDAGVLSVLNQEENLAFCWHLEGRRPPPYERAAPFKAVFHWWLHARGMTLVHAGAVGGRRGAALLVGKTGAGKSSTALTCLDAGMSFLADDHCLVAPADPPRVLGLYNSAKLPARDLHRYPRLAPKISNPEETGAEKALFWIHRHFESQIAREAPIRAIVLCRVSDQGKTGWRRVSGARVLRDLIPSTMVFLPRVTRADARAMSRLVQRTPCHLLSLGADPARIPSAIQHIIQETYDHDG
ncbi:MAG: hypothetical protein GY859_02460 [Desulfobacterales bacterium]|nr:hypothetical protein [Desulfobacterales bacterium]